jgi:hypothetical protein
MEQLKHLDSLSLREKKKYTGIPENWKLKPLCCFSDVSETEVYYAASEGGAAVGMAAFRKAQTFTLYFFNAKGEELLYFEKHGGLFASKMEIFDSSENLLGSVQKQGGGKAPHFQALDAAGKVLYDIEASPAAVPEKFYVRKGGVTVGRISKRSGRFAEEGVSRNVSFGIVFPLDAELAEKSVLLGALLLIDLSF